MAFKVSNIHWEIIISFMKLHPDLEKNRIIGPTGRDKMKRLWEELTNKLNSVGMGERSVQKWQKTWTDYKYILKRKASEMKKDLNSTGGGPSKGSLLTELDNRILAILGPTFYEGLHMPEQGCNFLTADTTSSVTSMMIDYSVPISEASPLEPSPGGSEDRLSVIGNTEHSAQKETPKRVLGDHSYIKQPLKKQPRKVTPDGKLEEMYKDTLKELKDINICLQGIKDALVNLVEVIKNK